MRDPMIGRQLERYEVLELVGEGGMGAVYRAHDTVLGRDVALKVMHTRHAREPEFQQRFLNEARSAAQLDHPGIVKVYDYRQDQDDLYIVMEFIRGRNLSQMEQHLKAQQQWFGLSEAVQIVREVGTALDYAHHKGVLHRDIKPANIMIKPVRSGDLSYQPVIADLGLARLGEGLGLTQAGVTMGTPFYMSPEQALGQVMDARSDVYSLGVLLYELAVGQLPFKPNTVSEAITLHTKQPPPLPRLLRPDLSPGLEHVILCALRKDPSARYPSAAALVQALDALPQSAFTETLPAASREPSNAKTQVELNIPDLHSQSVLGRFTLFEAKTDSLQLQGPGGQTKTVPITAKIVTVGRSGDNTVPLDDPKVSQHHLRIEYDGSRYRVTDLNSTNGIYLGAVRLLSGVAETWDPQKVLRIGDHHIRLVLALNKSTAGAVAGSEPSKPLWEGAAGGVVQEVKPGEKVRVALGIYNQSKQVDSFAILAEGIPSDWVVPSDVVNLYPDHRQDTGVTFHPALAPKSRAGDYAVKIYAESRNSHQKTLLQELTLRVLAYHRVDSALEPTNVKARRSAGVVLQNSGNVPQRFNVTWSDPDEEVKFHPTQAEVVVEPGQQTTTKYTARLQQRRWFGGRRPHPITVKVAAEGGESKEHQGSLQSRGLIPAWVPLLLMLLLVALGAFVVQQIGRPPAAVPPTPTRDDGVAVPPDPLRATEQSSGGSVKLPTDTPVPTSPPTDTPMPTATPTPLPPAKLFILDQVYLRSGPGTDYPSFGSAAVGQEFDLVAKSLDGQWWKICCANGQAAWVFGGYARATTNDVPVEYNVPPPPTATNTPEPTVTPTNTPIPPTYVIHAESVDDRLVCDLNGTQLFELRLGQGDVELDITPLIRQGSNTLSCRASDDQNGKSYRYSVHIYKDREEVKRWQDECTGRSCPVGSPTVLDAIYPFTYP